MTMYPDEDPIIKFLLDFMKDTKRTDSKVYDHVASCEGCRTHLKAIERHIFHAGWSNVA